MKKIILLFIFVFVVSCGFKPMLSVSKTNFSLNKIEYKNKLGKSIYNNLKQYLNKDDKKNYYTVLLNTTEKKKIILKDKKGNASSFRLTVVSEVSVYEGNQLKFTKKFKETFDYNNSSKKFELSKYDDEIKKNLLNKISNRIIMDIYKIQ